MACQVQQNTSEFSNPRPYYIIIYFDFILRINVLTCVAFLKGQLERPLGLNYHAKNTKKEEKGEVFSFVCVKLRWYVCCLSVFSEKKLVLRKSGFNTYIFFHKIVLQHMWVSNFQSQNIFKIRVTCEKSKIESNCSCCNYCIWGFYFPGSSYFNRFNNHIG